MTGLWRESTPLVLASASAARRGLLESAGLPIETRTSGIDERAIEHNATDLSPEALAERLALEKALAVSRALPGRLILGGDQVLACDGQRFHKPMDRTGALAQLRALSGRTHHLHSAGCLARDGIPLTAFVDTAALTMRDLDDASLSRYVDIAGSQALASVGCYQVEHLGSHLFERIDGHHATILGLPLLPLLAALRRLGCLAL